MSTIFGAMKGRLGTTDYYILSMKAQDLVNRVKIPKELEDWDDLKVEEHFQRDINYNRVKTQIGPYLANDDNRFFGAVIVAAFNFDENIEFEPLADVVPRKSLRASWRAETENMGFLNFLGGELLVPLDGQHRVKAIDFALTGRDEKGNDITRIQKPCTQLATEDVTVILIPYETKKARNIFTRVNRYAKPTTKGQNIIVDDDDIVAVISRQVANDPELIGGRLAKYTSSTLRKNDRFFTTLAIIYSASEAIINDTFPHGKIDKTELPSRDQQQLFKKKVLEVWEHVLDGIEVFADALHDKGPTGDDQRRKIRERNLLGKPVAQECLVRAFVQLTRAPTNMMPADACEKLNQLPWDMTEENLIKWQRILWAGGMNGKILTKNRLLATNMIAYMAGERLSDEQKQELLNNYRNQFPEAERENLNLPERCA